MKNKYYVTREGYEKLYQDIIGKDKQHDEVEREMGASVKRDNDLRENPEYMELRVKAMYGIPNEKRELVTKFQKAVIIEETDEYINWDGLTVIRKCKIELEMDGEIEKYTILGSNEGDLKNGILSCEAPLVKCILGKKIGETIILNNTEITGITEIIIRNVTKIEKTNHKKRELRK